MIAGTLEWHSGIAAGAAKDAEAVARLVASLTGLGAASKATGIDKVALEAERSAGRIAQIEARGEQQRLAQIQSFAARDVAAKNAALAAIVKSQAKGAQDIAKAQAKGEQDRLTEAAKAAAKLVQLEAKKEADLVKIAARGISDREKAERKAAEEIAKLHQQEQQGGGSSGGGEGGGEGGGSSIGERIVAKVVEYTKRIATQTYELLKAGELLAIEETSIRERSELQLEALLGSQREAEEAYTQVLDLANEVGLERADALAKMNDLLNAGFDKEGALDALHAIGDAVEVLGQSKGNALEASLVKIQSRGSLAVRDLTALAKIVPQTMVYDELAKSLGKSRQEIEALVKAGKITAAQGEAAVEAAVKARIGGLGERAGATLPRMIGDVEDELKKLFDHVDFSPLKDTLKNVFDLFKGPEGAVLKQSIETLFGTLNDTLFSQFKGEEGKARLAQVFTTAAAAAHTLAAGLRIVKPLIEGIVSLIEKFVRLSESAPVGWLSDKLFGKEGPSLGQKPQAKQAGVSAIGGVSGSVDGGATTAAQAAIGAGGQGSPPAAVKLGKDIAAGVAQGIREGTPDAVAAMLGLIGATHAGGKAEAKVHSPSELFADDIGYFLSAGVGVGVDKGAHLAVASVRTMMQDAHAAGKEMLGAGLGTPPMSAMDRVRASAAASGGSGPVMNFAAGSIVIQASSEEGGRAAARGFWDEIRALAEQR